MGTKAWSWYIKHQRRNLKRKAVLQYVDANDFDDASEYDDAMSRLGSMSMSSAYSSDDDTSPVNQLAGSPGRPTEVGCPLSTHFVFVSMHACTTACNVPTMPLSLLAPTPMLLNVAACSK